MAIMDETARARTWLNVLRGIENEDGVDIGDPALRDTILAAVDGADDWASANQASYNAALPEPFRSTASPRQKAAVLAFVLHERLNTGTE